MDPSFHFQLVIILISENDLHVLFDCVMKNPSCATTKSTAEINRYDSIRLTGFVRMRKQLT